MTLRLGDIAPDFTADTTEGKLRFHEWLGDSWGIIFSHPKDFTPVCTTELGYMAKLKPEFEKRKVKVIGLSVGPDKKIELHISYPMTTGRNFDEVLRIVDSLQRTAKHRVSTPVNWKRGDDVIIAGSVNNEEAKEIYPDGWKEPKPYIRIVPEPRA